MSVHIFDAMCNVCVLRTKNDGSMILWYRCTSPTYWCQVCCLLIHVLFRDSRYVPSLVNQFYLTKIAFVRDGEKEYSFKRRAHHFSKSGLPFIVYLYVITFVYFVFVFEESDINSMIHYEGTTEIGNQQSDQLMRNMSLEYCDLYNAALSSELEKPEAAVSWRKLDKEDAIRAVRKLINTKARNLSLPSYSDEFILRFLYARKMNVEGTFQLMTNYSDFRRNNPLLFETLSVKDECIQNCLNDGLPFVLKSRDRRGRRVLFFLLYQWDHTKYSIEAIYRALVLTMESLLEDVQNQVNGFVFIVDWTNFKLRDYFDFSPKMLKLMIDGFQDSFPAKIKGIHFVGQPWYVDGLLTFVKPFLKEKTREKLVIHGTNLSTLHEYLPRDVVPSDLGGEGKVYKPEEWIEILEEYENKSR